MRCPSAQVFSISKNYSQVSLVVAKGYRDVNLIDSKLTMTDLKKHSGTTVADYLLNSYSETSRLFPLFKEVKNILMKYHVDIREINKKAYEFYFKKQEEAQHEL